MAARGLLSKIKMADDEGYIPPSEGCPYCGRTFNPDSLARHIPICAKTSQKKRKVFDSGKQRAQGSDIPLKSTKKTGQPTKSVPTPKNNWRQKHDEFIAAIRNARGVQQAMKTGGPLPPPPPPTINPDYIQCQYCQRRFNETAAARHIPFCKEKNERIGGKPVISAQAKQRAEARKQFRPPRLKPKTEIENSTTGFGGGYGTSTSYARPPGSGRGGGGNPKSAGNRPTRTTASGASDKRPHSVDHLTYEGTKNDYCCQPVRRDSDGLGGYGNMTKSSSTGQVNSPIGQPMRTGRNPQTYADAKKSVRSTNVGRGMSRYSNSSESLTRISPVLSPSELDYYKRVTPPQSGRSNNRVTNSQGRQGSAGSRFCHECGTQYPVATAKFCCECGIRRISMEGNSNIYGY